MEKIRLIITNSNHELLETISINDIWIGDICIATNYQFKTEGFFKPKEINNENNGKKTFDKEVKIKNTYLVRLGKRIYVELKEYNKELLNQQMEIDGSNVYLEIFEDGIIVLDEPYKEGMYFIDKNSLRKFEYKKGYPTGVSSHQYQKVKKMIMNTNSKQ